MVLADAEIVPEITIDDSPMSPNPPECERCCRELRVSFKTEKITPVSTPLRPQSPEDPVYHEVEELLNNNNQQQQQQQQEQQGVINNINEDPFVAQYFVPDEIEQAAYYYGEEPLDNNQQQRQGDMNIIAPYNVHDEIEQAAYFRGEEPLDNNQHQRQGDMNNNNIIAPYYVHDEIEQMDGLQDVFMGNPLPIFTEEDLRLLEEIIQNDM